MNETVSGEQQKNTSEKPLVSAGFFTRVIARIIDFIIVIALYEIIPVLGYFAGLVYMSIADGLFQGRSVGKRLMGIKVLIRSEDGSSVPCGYRESVFRNVPFLAGYLLFGILKGIPLIGWLLSFVVITVVIVFESLVTVGNEKGMRLGDEIARSLVVENEQGG